MLDCEYFPFPELTMQLEFTAVYRKVPEGYVAFVEELPGANTQGGPWRRPGKTSARRSS